MPIVIASNCISFKTSVLSLLLSEYHLFPLHSLRTSDFLQPHFQPTGLPSFFCQHLLLPPAHNPYTLSSPASFATLFLHHAQLENPSLGVTAPFRSRMENSKCDWKEMATHAIWCHLKFIAISLPQGAHASHQLTPFPRSFIIPLSEGTISQPLPQVSPPTLLLSSSLSAVAHDLTFSQNTHIPPAHKPAPCHVCPHLIFYLPP